MLSCLPMLTVRVRLGVPCVGGALCPPGRGKTWAGAAALGHCPRCRGSGTLPGMASSSLIASSCLSFWDSTLFSSLNSMWCTWVSSLPTSTRPILRCAETTCKTTLVLGNRMFSTVITVCFWLSNDMLSLFSRKLAELHHGLQSAANKVVEVAVLQLTPHAPTCLVIACRGHRYNQPYHSCIVAVLATAAHLWPWLRSE